MCSQSAGQVEATAGSGEQGGEASARGSPITYISAVK